MMLGNRNKTGVCFRMYTEDQARKLGVVGWVRNTRRGTVEGQVQGKEELVNSIPCFFSEQMTMMAKEPWDLMDYHKFNDLTRVLKIFKSCHLSSHSSSRKKRESCTETLMKKDFHLIGHQQLRYCARQIVETLGAMEPNFAACSQMLDYHPTGRG
ncbi:acylphosphatase 2, muscle type isoform X2 [Mustelus asterias]